MVICVARRRSYHSSRGFTPSRRRETGSSNLSCQQPGVRGRHAIVEGRRIGVHDVIGLLQNVEMVDTVVKRCFQVLTRAQVYECLAYHVDHRGRDRRPRWPARWAAGAQVSA